MGGANDLIEQAFEHRVVAGMYDSCGGHHRR